VIAMTDLLAVATNLLAILQVILALGLVIFVHELGHFLAARWCGVHVERFSIGFGPPLIRWTSRKTGTEYWIAWIPFGGYVKMKGQDDIDPEKMTDEELRADPTAYPGKPVWQRMTIISAGVLMNVVFGFFCFIVMYNAGPEYIPPQVGLVKPGGPAWQAGLAPGDRIVSINGRDLVKFKDLQVTVQLSDPQAEPLLFVYERDGARQSTAIRPEQTALWPQIGIANPTSPQLSKDWPIPAESPAAAAGLQPGDRILAVGDTPVATGEEVKKLLARRPNAPVELTVETSPAPGEQVTSVKKCVLPPQPMRELPVVLEMGPVVAVRQQLDANGDRLQVGDVILELNGRPVDPFRLPDEVRALAGQEIELLVRRPAPDGTETTKVLRLVPTDQPTWLNEPIFPDSPLECPGLGIAYEVKPVVRSVGSMAEEDLARPGDRIVAVRLDPGDATLAEFVSDEWVEITQDGTGSGLPSIFWMLQQMPHSSLEVRLRRGENQIQVRWEPKRADDWFVPTRGLVFEPLVRRLPPLGLIGSVRQGWRETINILRVMYVGLERMFIRHTISPTSVRGPITIARVFYQQAKKSWTEYLFTLALFSLNLAVMNFLPIPVLDGGHMVFLIWEGITRRPPSRKVQIGLSYLGLALILGLMLWVTVLDIRDLF